MTNKNRQESIAVATQILEDDYGIVTDNLSPEEISEIINLLKIVSKGGED